jgi:hypothetical protein
LLDAAGFGVHDQAHAAQVVADDVVGLAIAQQGAGYVGFVGVDEDAANAAVGLELGHGPQVILVDQAVLQGAVLALSNAPIEQVYEVVDRKVISLVYAISINEILRDILHLI